MRRSLPVLVALGTLALIVSCVAACAGESQAGCGPSNCQGCCQAGKCIAPTPTACGLGGAVCTPCPSGQECSAGSCRAVSNCAASCEGCCKDGFCLPGTSSASCGIGGGPCRPCAGSETCAEGACVPAISQCTAARCPLGCCKGAVCNTARDTACGSAGAQCVDCTAKGGKCMSGVCSLCTPQCTGKCVGASDGCGGYCTTNGCMGCCSGTTCFPTPTDAACGFNGSQCADCRIKGGTCSAGTCTSCTPSCSGKCPGASNDCGGTCSANSCPGCCQGNVCVNPPTAAACGINGSPCASCGASPCTAGTCGGCTPQCAGKCPGAPNTCGGACTTNGCTGCCWGATCVNPPTDGACGIGGKPCANCAAVSGGKCNTTTGACSSCTPKCQGQCQYQLDGCGGFCPTSDCGGCCYPDEFGYVICITTPADWACFPLPNNGGKCEDCTVLKQKCTAGYCSGGCTPDCAKKCMGEDDGCGGGCPSNTCATCCYPSAVKWCISTGSYNWACGSGGKDCEDCTAIAPGWYCISETAGCGGPI